MRLRRCLGSQFWRVVSGPVGQDSRVFVARRVIFRVLGQGPIGRPGGGWMSGGAQCSCFIGVIMSRSGSRVDRWMGISFGCVDAVGRP